MEEFGCPRFEPLCQRHDFARAFSRVARSGRVLSSVGSESAGLRGESWLRLAMDVTRWGFDQSARPKGTRVGKKSGRNPCDRGKSGVKRSTLTEAAGLVVGLAIEGANRHDMKLVRETLETVPTSLAARRDELRFGVAHYDVERAWSEAQHTLFTPCFARTGSQI